MMAPRPLNQDRQVAKHKSRRDESQPQPLRWASVLIAFSGVALVGASMAVNSTRFEDAGVGLMLIGIPIILLGAVLKWLDWSLSLNARTEGSWDHHHSTDEAHRDRAFKDSRSSGALMPPPSQVKRQVPKFRARSRERLRYNQPERASQRRQPPDRVMPIDLPMASAVQGGAVQPHYPQAAVNAMAGQAMTPHQPGAGLMGSQPAEPAPPGRAPSRVATVLPFKRAAGKSPDVFGAPPVHRGAPAQPPTQTPADVRGAAQPEPEPDQRLGGLSSVGRLTPGLPPLGMADLAAGESEHADLDKVIEGLRNKLQDLEPVPPAVAQQPSAALQAQDGSAPPQRPETAPSFADTQAVDMYDGMDDDDQPWSEERLIALHPTQFAGLVEKLFEQGGFSTRVQMPEQGRGPIVLWLYSRFRAGEPASVVYCVHAPGQSVDTATLVALGRSVSLRSLPRGQLATSSHVSAPARALALAHKINVLDLPALLALIEQRSPEEQRALNTSAA
jgi:Restriction endonuclease